MAPINAGRLIADLRALASIGKFGTGVDRVALSAADIEARRWLMSRMREAGLAAQMDRVGNVYGRYPEVDRAVLVGSHTDTVPQGGWLDGALGVIYGLEIAVPRSRREARRGRRRRRRIPGRGRLVPALSGQPFVLRERHRGGDPRRRNQRTAGRLPMPWHVLLDEAPLIRRDADRVLCYLEAHIEQGPRLESHGAAHRRRHRAGRNSPLSASAAGAGRSRRHHADGHATRTPAWRCSGWGRGLRTNFRAWAARHGLEHREHRVAARRRQRRAQRRRDDARDPRHRHADARPARADGPGLDCRGDQRPAWRCMPSPRRGSSRPRCPSTWPRQLRPQPESAERNRFSCRAAPVMMPWCSAGSCPRRCCSCPASAVAHDIVEDTCGSRYRIRVRGAGGAVAKLRQQLASPSVERTGAWSA